MPIPSQQGDVATRLRRFFGITGRISTSVDELVVPVALTANLDDFPYKQYPVRGVVAMETAASGANVQASGIQAPPGGVVVVRRICFGVSVAGGIHLRSRNVDIAVAGYSGGTPGTGGASANQRNHISTGAARVDFLAAAFAGSTVVAATRQAVNTPQEFEFPWVLYPGDSLIIGPTAVNVSYNGWMSYDLYLDPGLIPAV